jgi:hypothetical protein
MQVAVADNSQEKKVKRGQPISGNFGYTSNTNKVMT